MKTFSFCHSQHKNNGQQEKKIYIPSRQFSDDSNKNRTSGLCLPMQNCGDCKIIDRP